MARIRRINVSQIEGNQANETNDSEIRPYGEIGLYEGDYNQDIDNDRLELLIFDGKRTHLRSKVLSPGIFYGSGDDSADETYGFDTIKLIPDAELHYNNGGYGNDQYLVIDPTGPNHIHIRAGGTQDDSGAQLFLGGEISHFSVGAGNNPPLYLKANDNQWTLGTDGAIYLPASGALHPVDDNAGLVLYDTDNSNRAQLAAIGNINLRTDSTNEGNEWTFDTNGDLSVPNYINFKDGSFIGDEGSAGTPVFRIDAAAGQGISLTSDTGIENANHTWLFGADGTLTLPGDAYNDNSKPTIIGNYSINLRPSWNGTGTSPMLAVEWNDGISIRPITNDHVTGSNKTTPFFIEGSSTTVGGRLPGDVYINSGRNGGDNVNGAVNIGTGWTDAVNIGQNGTTTTITFEDGSVQTTAYTGLSILDGYATETYVDTAIAAVVDSAPELLNTLNELSAALGNDENFVNTVTNQISLKANTADLATVATSGSYNDLTDTPAAFDPAGLATEAYVDEAISGFNAYDQSLNTTDTVGFQSVTATDVNAETVETNSVALGPQQFALNTTIYSAVSEKNGLGIDLRMTSGYDTDSNVSGDIVLSIDAGAADKGTIQLLGDVSFNAAGTVTNDGEDNLQIASSNRVNLQAGSVVNIAADASEWQFDTSGALVFPDETQQTTAWTGTVSYNDLTDTPELASTGSFTLTSANQISTANAAEDITFIINGTDNNDPPALIQKAWALGTDGSIKFLDPMDFLDPVRATITATKVGNWDTAYSWGDHSTFGYLTSADLSTYATTSYVDTANTNIENLLNTEIINRDTSVTAVQNNLDSEVQDRIDADTDLQNQINNLVSNIDPAALDSLTEIIAAFNAGDSSIVSTVNNLQISLQASIDTEISDRQDADATLQASIDALSTVATTGSYNDLIDVPTNLITTANIGSYEQDPVFESWKATTYDVSAAATILADDIFNWNAANSWGDHSLAGYLTTATFNATTAAAITPTQVTNWDTAYGWGDHSLAGYLTSATLGETDPIFEAWKTATYDVSAAATITSVDVANWNTAYNWGDHSVADYLTSATFNATPAATITSTQVINWDTAYGWGDHRDAGYATPLAVETALSSYATNTYVDNKIADVVGAAPEALNTLYEIAAAINDDSSFASTVMTAIGTKLDASSPAGSIDSTDIDNWNTAYNWGDHSTVGYLTAVNESDPVFTASAAAEITAGDIATWNTVSVKANTADLATVATSGSYNDLSDKPFFYDSIAQSTFVASGGGAFNVNVVGSTLEFQFTPADIPTLATVATSGSYDDLNDKPIKDSGFVNCPANVSTPIYTASSGSVSTIKITVQIEKFGTPIEIQSSEIIVARAQGTNTVVSSVYGTVYSGTAALGTFAAAVNVSGVIEVTCQSTGNFGITVRAVATEIITAD